MYLLSVYFDNHTNKVLQNLIDRIARETGNTFMTDNKVPPHLTISAVEARGDDVLLPVMEQLKSSFQSGQIDIISPGMFLPYVLYATPVLNSYLQELSQHIYDAVKNIPEVKVSEVYQPMQWLPHITLGKKLEREQMQIALELVQDHFQPISSQVVALGLAKTNPHREIVRITHM